MNTRESTSHSPGLPGLCRPPLLARVGWREAVLGGALPQCRRSSSGSSATRANMSCRDLPVAVHSCSPRLCPRTCRGRPTRSTRTAACPSSSRSAAADYQCDVHHSEGARGPSFLDHLPASRGDVVWTRCVSSGAGISSIPISGDFSPLEEWPTDPLGA